MHLDSPPTSNDRTWAIAAHATGLLLFTNIPFANVLGALFVYLKVKGDADKPFARASAVAALNFQITWTILFFAYMIAAIWFWYYENTEPMRQVAFSLGPGIIILGGVTIALLVANVVLSIVGSIRASNAQAMKYPLAWRIVR